MSSVWTIVHFEESFMEPLEKYSSDTLTALREPPALDAVEALTDRWDALKTFTRKILEIKEAPDPVSLLVAACEPNGEVIPEIYVLRIEQWVAYYRIDQDARLCTGILIHHDDDSIIDGLGSTLSDIFARLAKPNPPSSK